MTTKLWKVKKEVHLIWHKNKSATSLPSRSYYPYLQTLSCHLYASTNRLNMPIKVWIRDARKSRIQIFNTIVSTLWSILNFFSCFSRRSIQSKASSYSIVLGWEQCEVDTAFFWKRNSCVNISQRKENIAEYNYKALTCSSRCFWPILILYMDKCPTRVPEDFGTLSNPLLQ